MMKGGAKSGSTSSDSVVLLRPALPARRDSLEVSSALAATGASSTGAGGGGFVPPAAPFLSSIGGTVGALVDGAYGGAGSQFGHAVRTFAVASATFCRASAQRF